MPVKINCCEEKNKAKFTLNTLIIYGREKTNQYSATPLPEKEEYQTMAQIKTMSPYTQHYNTNNSITPLDYDTKATVRYNIQTNKIQNDWYVYINEHRLRVKGLNNLDKQNKYITLYLKTEKSTND